jgi:hypothetical protein
MEELYVMAGESGQWEQVHWSIRTTVQGRRNSQSQDMPSELTVGFKSQFYDQMAVPGALKTSATTNFYMNSPEKGAL